MCFTILRHYSTSKYLYKKPNYNKQISNKHITYSETCNQNNDEKLITLLPNNSIPINSQISN